MEVYGVRTNPLESCVGLVTEEHENWNPLTNDGDALRLAVKLRLDTNCGEFSTACSWFPHTTEHDVVMTHNGADPYAATRRAIVRAAAEIGKGMK